MKYISTRGQTEPCGFIDAFLTGLADDGGLLVPNTVPVISKEQLEEWRSLSYAELAYRILSLYVDGEIPDDVLKQMVEKSYSTFRSPDVTPLHRLNDQLQVLELFHGPTLSFKDVALQFIGNLYSYVSQQYDKRINILGATSGDTGSAAIHGVRSKPGIKICILHPEGKVSEVQALQMTTVMDDNVLNLAVRGNFDDCQQLVKDLFNDLEFKRSGSLRAINSINVVRILAQTIYYFYSYFRLRPSGWEPVSYSVPSGNFGDIFAGYLAKRMGLPVGRLLLATNENNILERFVQTGVYRPGGFRETFSPAMDIQVASNFERYLFFLFGQDAARVADTMRDLKEKGAITVQGDELATVQRDFFSSSVNGEQCLDTIKHYHQHYGYLLDPHTACGVKAYEDAKQAGELQAGDICAALSTAHPGKFDEAIERVGIKQDYPQEISSLFGKEKRFDVIDNDKNELIARLKSFFG